MTAPRLTPLRITLIYLVAGGFWILFSDILISFFYDNPITLSRAQTFKGLLFVSVTALTLYFLLTGYMRSVSRSEAKQRRSEEKYRKLMETANDAIVVADAGTGIILEANNKAAELFGIPVEQLVGMHQTQLHPEEENERYGRIFEEHVRGGKGLSTDLFICRKDGSRIPVEISASVADLGDKKIIQGIFRDITKRKLMEDELRKLEDHLRSDQKMDAIGQLAGGIAHDFNNILTAIIGYGSLLRSNLEKDSLLRPHIEQILTSAEKATNLTQQILSFSRKRMIDVKPVDLNDLIRDVEKIMLRLIGEDIELDFRPSDSGLVIMADGGQIDQVLINLATNARDAMPDGGVLTISTSPVEIDSEFIRAHGFGKPGSYALLTVSDTGIGLDEGVRERIFEPFFTTKEVGRGTGLGLSVVYGIIGQHGGHVDVDSEPGKGTSFRIYFPVVGFEPEGEPLRSRVEPAGGTETVLVAEDDAEVRKLTKTVLEGRGYSVIEAIDGADAVNKFIDRKNEIGLVILDVVMPRMNGKEVIDEIMKIRPDARALFMSGYTADILCMKGVAEGNLNFISKPLSPEELLQRVREILDN